MTELSSLETLRQYQAVFLNSSQNPAMKHSRFIVLDTETSGTNPLHDRIVSIGCVGVYDNEIVLADSFEIMLKIQHNLAAVTVHGITRDEAKQGFDEATALLLFLNYVSDAVIIGHHVGFDHSILNQALLRHFGIPLQNLTLDTMDMTLKLIELDLIDDSGLQGYSLDSLCKLFAIKPHDRHTAAGDAFITAQIFLRLLKIGHNHGLRQWSDYCNTPTPDSE